MRRFVLGTELYDGSFAILRKSARGNYTDFGKVLCRRAGDLVAYSWRENFGDVEWGCFDTPEQALAAFVQDRKDRKAARAAKEPPCQSNP